MKRSLICRIFGHVQTMIVDRYGHSDLTGGIAVTAMHPECKRCGRRLPELP